jgi:phosphoadenosine phosphosulfate reductase
LPDLDIAYLNTRFEHASPQEILRWAWETFGTKAAISSSFQTQSVPLLHLVAQTCPGMAVLFLDTGFHFPETLTFRDQLQAHFKLNLVVVRPAIEKSQLIAQHGEGLYRRDPDLCCYINKVEPMQRAISGLQAWLSGVRRDQTAHRQALSVVQPDTNGLLKIHPLLNWTKKDVWAYIDQHQLPAHPLFSKGYLSVGCAPCTRPVMAGEDERAGRWAGLNKAECGLHLELKSKEE